MQSAGQHDQWPAAPGAQQPPTSHSQHRRPPSPPLMSANVNGPVDPLEFYRSFSPTSTDGGDRTPIASPFPTASTARAYNLSPALAARSISQSPERKRMASNSDPATSAAVAAAAARQRLTTMRSQPVMNSRQPGNVKAMASNINQDRTLASRLPGFSQTQNTGVAKSHRRRPVPSKLTNESPRTSFEDTSTSFSSNASAATASSQLSSVTSPVSVRSPNGSNNRPLFGEITADGQWNGTGISRSLSQDQLVQPVGLHDATHTLHHKRSRSDMGAIKHSQPPRLPPLDMSTTSSFRSPPRSPNSRQTNSRSNSRIPVRGRRMSADSVTSPSSATLSSPSARATAPMSSPDNNRQAIGNENDKSSLSLHNRRYNPPTLVGKPHLLSAQVVAPPPKVSPPLRSSRPRQPVSDATTAASRARAAANSPKSPSNKKPSEQWLGKPYDPQQQPARRKIPELGNIDFAARRERIQKAISQNLDHSRSLESLHSRSSRSRSRGPSSQRVASDAKSDGLNPVDQKQAAQLDQETDLLDLPPKPHSPPPLKSPLTVETSNLPQPVMGETFLDTADTDITQFEFDDSPVPGRTNAPAPTQLDSGLRNEVELLSSATYQPPKKKAREQPPVVLAVPTTTEEVDYSADASPSDIEERWGLGRSDHGSIRIMLDGGPNPMNQRTEDSAASHPVPNGTIEQPQHLNGTPNGFDESPVDPRIKSPKAGVTQASDHPGEASKLPTLALRSEDTASNPVVVRAIDEYRSTGRLNPALLDEMQKHSLDLNRISANGGSDANLIQNLLDSIAAHQPQTPQNHGIPAVTPYTPPDALNVSGTAIVYNNLANDQELTPERRSQDAVLGSDDEDDFAAQIRRADEEWERRQRGDVDEDDLQFISADESRPTPPPKDHGYTPRSSFGPDSTALTQEWTDAPEREPELEERPEEDEAQDEEDEESTPLPTSAAPPLPAFPPPPPPQSSMSGSQTLPQAQPSPQQQSAEQSPTPRTRVWPTAPGSTRPSVDGQRPSAPITLPSQSISSLTDPVRQDSIDASADAQAKPANTAPSPSPEQKRLAKRRHIIRELLDTENSYHQDLKIIEDIYKATINEFVTPEDKKTLFGNCDEIERFSLSFYDQLRKAAVSVYVPSKNVRWGNKRGSISTTQSESTGQGSVSGQGSSGSPEAIDDEKDRTSYIGKVFLDNMQRMEQLYGAYLKNHDAANQRLSALQSTPTVKFWLDECHSNASDITSAWDLDSLLVKPTQRVSKYPLIMQQLLETTPADHPDHDALKSAARDTIAMLTRINDAKKRADLVEQMISGKRKDTDVRSGLAKAFGRRTERLKERVGINEAFQDPDFDALAQQFGGHYIRLQISMRDVQDYVNRVDKAIEQINNYAAALELFTDVLPTSLPEIESKWRRYGLTIRELTAVSSVSHKDAIQNRVIAPMITLIKIHEHPQAAINKRKRRIVDYARCKSIEKRGERPDKKTLEASEMYEALNDQLKIELPKLYDLTGKLVREVLKCFLGIQLEWQQTWERKLRHIIDAKDIPRSIQDIIPAFSADHDLIQARFGELSICNGSALEESAHYTAPSTVTTLTESDSFSKRPSTLDGSKRAMSLSSDASPQVQTPSSSKRQSGAYSPDVVPPLEIPSIPRETRMRSNSSMSARGNQTPTPLTSANRPWSNSNTTPPSSAFPGNLPHAGSFSSASGVSLTPDTLRVSRPGSSANYYPARSELPTEHSSQRFSGMFSSAMPPPDTPDLSRAQQVQTIAPVAATSAPALNAPGSMPVLFVCASLFEFNIDKARKEAGYPYLTYDQGEVFDVVAQKGELWLAKNQDDNDKTLGWIWEQHFVILSQD